MKSFLTSVAAMIAMLLSPVLAQAETDMPTETGLAAGEQIPAISLIDGEGASRDLASLVGSKGAVLMFVRSADWCSYCKNQMISMDDISADLAAEGYPLYAIVKEDQSIANKFKTKRNISYEILTDEGFETIKAFGILNTKVKETSKRYGIPHPAIYVINSDGVIEAKMMEESFKKRPATNEVLNSVQKLG